MPNPPANPGAPPSASAGTQFTCFTTSGLALLAPLLYYQFTCFTTSRQFTCFTTSRVALLAPLLYYLSANPGAPPSASAGTQFTCFTSTKVQIILTPEELQLRPLALLVQKFSYKSTNTDACKFDTWGAAAAAAAAASVFVLLYENFCTSNKLLPLRPLALLTPKFSYKSANTDACITFRHRCFCAVRCP